NSALGLYWIPPEMREDQGEIELAMKGETPRLVEDGDVHGEFHVHTNATDGVDSVETMVDQAKALGYAFVGISDHSVSSAVAFGLSAEKALARRDRFRELNQSEERRVGNARKKRRHATGLRLDSAVAKLPVGRAQVGGTEHRWRSSDGTQSSFGMRAERSLTRSAERLSPFHSGGSRASRRTATSKRWILPSPRSIARRIGRRSLASSVVRAR